MVMFDETFDIARRLRDAFRAEGITLREIASIGHLDFALVLVAAGAGALVLPYFNAKQAARKSLTVVPLDCLDLHWKLVQTWRRGVPLSEAGQAWLAMAMAMAKSHFG